VSERPTRSKLSGSTQSAVSRVASRIGAVSLVVLAAAPTFACSSVEPLGPLAPDNCTVELESGCWTLLGLEGEWVVEVAVSPWGAFVGTRSGRIFRLDPDRRWHALGPDTWRDQLVATALLYVPAEPPRLLAGMDFATNPDDTTRAAVYASFDQGQSWLPSDGGLAEDAPGNLSFRVFANGLAVDPRDPNRLLMANGQGMLRSLDAGETWDFVFGGFDLLPDLNDVLFVHPDRAEQVWVGGQTLGFLPRVATSRDFGDTWQFGSPRCDGPVNQNSVRAFSIDPNVHDRLWVGTMRGVIRADGGSEADDSWTCGSAPTEFVVGFAELDGALYVVTRLSSSESSFGPVFRTTDGGVVWDTLSVPLAAAEPSVTAVASDSTHGRILIGTSSGLWALTP
jgi:photosystem II stability/assembly factor-like uncharacterized protein